ncbi:TonB-dependent receptor [Roseateles sp. BYS87W]|uniref:TonB-dependent receptor plug domain-containing protein n=1 Tax=Pelomonas baiyunensis TaxID=3299026 RepID=A0ABW7H1N2_9BURK
MSMSLRTPARRSHALSSTALAVGLLMFSAAHAQQTSGSLNAVAAKGDKVTVVSKAIGISREQVADKDGAVAFNQLPAGDYVVTILRADGSTVTRNISVQPGQNASVNVAQLEQVIVTGLATKAIDVKSAESVQILSKSEIDRIPVARNTTAIALLAPGATLGDGRIGSTSSRAGNVPSLGGASPAENAYYINGFNVTNIVNGVAFNSVPFEAVGSQQVKTGGYGAEFGRSLGGVISVTTKRGTDEWHGGANVTWEPDSMRGSAVFSKKDDPNSTNPNDWYLAKGPGYNETLRTNVWAGGPLIADTLYGFALVQAGGQKIRSYGTSQQSETKNDTPQYLLKLDWNINKNHTLEFTSFSDKSTDKIQNWKQVTANGTAKGDSLGTDEYTSGGDTNILKWTGWLTDDLTVSALYGVGKYKRTSAVESAGCPYVQDRRTAPTKILGCATTIPISDPKANDKRTAYRVDAEYSINPQHTLRAGLDSEVYDTVDGSVYPGPDRKLYQIRRLGAGSRLSNGYVNGATPMDYVQVREYFNGGTFKTENAAWYVEDNWQVTKNLLVNIGLRNESFTNKNADGIPFVKVNNTYAPRLAAAWDVMGNADLKVYSNVGRYYIPVYANTNVRLSGQQLDKTNFYAYTGSNSADKFQVPGLGAKLGGEVVNSPGAAPDPRTIVDPNLKPMFQDEFIAGFQKALTDRWSVGFKYTHRVLKSSMDDICFGAGAAAWAAKNGYTADQAAAIGDTVDHCFLGNPGRDLTANVDLNGDGKLVAVTIPNSALMFPEKPKRTYDALEFTFERAWDKKWSFQGSYVLAFSKGNTEGYVKSDIGQDDAGISQDWDYPGLMEGANGYLPNDRRHTFKFWGSYAATDEVRLGANVMIQSGRPKNCLGYYGGTLDDVSIAYGSSAFYCGGKLVPRGSVGRLKWFKEVNLQATYTPTWLKGATVSVDLLNIFNTRTVRAINEAGEEALGTPSPTYGQPGASSIQGPRRVRILAQYEF